MQNDEQRQHDCTPEVASLEHDEDVLSEAFDDLLCVVIHPEADQIVAAHDASELALLPGMPRQSDIIDHCIFESAKASDLI